MATYKFDNLELELVDPVVSISGQVGTTVVDNVPSDEAYADVILETTAYRYAVRLEGSPAPIDWTMPEIISWVSTQLVKYEV